MTNEDSVVVTIRKAVDAIAKANVPEDLRAVAFAHAIDMLQSEQSPKFNARVATPNVQPMHRGIAGKIARDFGIPEELLESVYDIQTDRVDLVVHRSKLPKQKAPAMKVVATLVAAGRQAAGIEDWTAAEVVRDACRQIGVFDRSNFAMEVASLGDVFLVRGKGQSREFKVTRHGYEEAGRLISQLGSWA